MTDTTPTIVPGVGPLDARLIVIGEAPGPHEVHHAPPTPFVGPSGWRLGEWLEAVGLVKAHARLDNVCQVLAPKNTLALVPRVDLEAWMADLHVRLSHLTDPWLIVPLGNYALFALLGLGKVKWATKAGKLERPGITAHRGSIYEYVGLGGRRVKVIPSIHPAATFDQPALERACRMDWEKVAHDLTFRDLAMPTRRINAHPTPLDVAQFHQRAYTDPTRPLAFDIERPAGTVTRKGKPTKAYPEGKPLKVKDYRAGKVACISFSLDPLGDTVTIPIVSSHWKAVGAPNFDPWRWIRALLGLSNPKVTQNGLFDCWHLEELGVPIVNWQYDSLYLHHAENARDKHSLEYMVSMFLRAQYYKDEAKDPDQLSGWTDNLTTLYLYCGKDSAYTLELAQLFLARQTPEIAARYADHYVALFAPLLRLMRTGLRVDVAEAARRLAGLKAEMAFLRAYLKAETGAALLAAKALSNTKLATYLYTTLGLPTQYEGRGRAKHITTNEVTIKRLALTYPHRFPEGVSSAILRARRCMKVQESYAPEHFDPDGRMRSAYSPNTQQGRLSSKKNPSGSGTNGQNLDKEARDVYLADEGHVMVIVDLSQGESRINRAYIYSLTGDEETLRKARALPADWDDHSDMVRRIFGTTRPDEVTANRPLGKMIVHASQRRMQGETLAAKILKERGEIVLPEDATKLIARAIDAQPGLLDYFRWVEWQIQRDRCLTSCWGVPLWFTYDRLDSATYRDGYSFLMQDGVGRLTNQRGVRWLWEESGLWQPRTIELNADWHDGLLISCPPNAGLIFDLCEGLTRSLATPIVCNGVELSIPSEVTIGRHTGGEISWKCAPTEAQLNEALRDLADRPPLHGEGTS